ncbi:MAG: hypothetical protein ACI9G1_005436 [Pirellulaceae bacterium]
MIFGIVSHSIKQDVRNQRRATFSFQIQATGIQRAQDGEFKGYRVQRFEGPERQMPNSVKSE